MRLVRLLLGRYGHLCDVDLKFPADRGLHIVLGANEAGKSTALAAIGDCLFGFPHSTPFAFLHAARDLRLGVSLRAGDGREATFFRRKGRKDDLLDAQDQPVPESAIAGFLGGATRDRFNRVFGLNSIELRRGGDAILNGEGEVGEAIMQAHTGLHGFRALVEKFDAEAAALFGDKRGRREFHLASERFTKARQQVAERRIEPADYKQKQDELSRLDASRKSNTDRAMALHAELSKLQRIRRAAPARLAIARAAAARDELGPVPALPADAAAKFQDALARRETAVHDLRREQARHDTLESALQDLPSDPPILAEAETVDTLTMHRQRILETERDRVTQAEQARQQAVAIVDGGRRLGLIQDADQLAARIPNALNREVVSRTLARHERLVGQQAKADDDLSAAQSRLAEAQAAWDALAEPTPSAGLRAVIDTVRAEGRLDADRAEAIAAQRAAETECGRALAALPLWGRDAAALAALPMPLDAQLEHHADGLKARAEALRRAEDRVAAIDQTLSELDAEAQADIAAGEPPTAAAIQAARDRRDQAWQLIRRRTQESGAAPAAHDPVLPDRFEALMRVADDLADRRAAERERVVQMEKRKAAQISQRALRLSAETDREQAAANQTAALQAWRDLWTQTGMDPLEPAAMREWVQRRGAILSLHARVLDAADKASRLQNRHTTACASLVAGLQADTTAANDDLSALLAAASRECLNRERQEEVRTKARQAIDTSRSDVRKAEEARARVESSLAAWKTDWAAAAPVLGLPPDASAEQGLPALNLWNEIDAAVRARTAALDRVAAMDKAIDWFAALARAVAGRVAPELVDSSANVIVTTLTVRLADARTDEVNRNKLFAERAAAQEEIGALGLRWQAAASTLTGLRAVAGADNDDALSRAIDRAAEHRALAEQIEARSMELRGLDDGRSLQQLEAEADGIDLDDLPGTIAALEAQLRDITTEDLANQARVTDLKRDLAGMETGHDAAGAAQEVQTALADIEDVAARYVPLRMAHILLRAGIDRFRRQQQDPLLNRAGHIFARLTEGRYDRLGVDEEDGKMLIKACRPDGTECLADRLSEGTLDQLYLALRLAAIESYARGTEPLPFIADDLLVNFDDRRAVAAIRVLADFGRVTQVILFTHHGHIAEMAEAGSASVHRLSAEQSALIS